MNKLRSLTYCIVASVLLHGCSKILEPVSFYGTKIQNNQNQQEEFTININPLTFSSASKANLDPYTRKLMLKGSGSQANVIKEADLVNEKFPRILKKPVYVIGIGDEISFTLEKEFLNNEPQWPELSTPTEYLIGVGDQLTLILQSKPERVLPVNGDGVTYLSIKPKETLLETNGVVGTNGNILLLGIGNISVGNRSLSDVRAEIRNILIRDGLAPNFQLEITGFNSKKAFIVSPNSLSNMIQINNIPITLKEIVLGAGISHSSKNKTIITLKRHNHNFRITAKQLLKETNSEIYIHDGDSIEIKTATQETITHKSIVDSKGHILLPQIGKMRALGKTIAEIQKETTRVLSEDGLKPKFQLELTGFNSKFLYYTNQNMTVKVPLTNKSVSIRELILNRGYSALNNDGLNIVTLKRAGQEYLTNIDQVLNPQNKDIWLQDADQVEVKTLNYKPGQVFALSGSGSAKILQIDPSKRETLADVLFVDNGALSNSFAQRSEIYLLRGRSPSKAYHLDAQNVSRLLVAARIELRPNDIIFVAERPIISFTRTLAEITPLRILLRDIQDDNIP